MISFREESTKNGCRTSPVALGTGLYTSVALPSRNVPRTFPEPSCRQSRFTLSLAHSPCFAGSSDGAWRSFSPWGHGISTSGRHCPASWPSALHPFSPSFFSSVALTSSAVPSPTGKRAVLSASSVCTPHGGTPGLVICSSTNGKAHGSSMVPPG